MAEADTVQIPTVTQPTAGETVATMSKFIKTAGLPTDAKSSATDATAVTHTSVFKQISFSIQAAAASLASLVTAIGSTAWDLGSGTAGTRTQRFIQDSSQMSTIATVAKTLADGYQLVALPTDQPAIPTKDAGPNWTTVWGVSSAPFTSADAHSAAASVTDAPTSGQKIVVDDLFFSTDTAMSVTFKAESSGAVIAGPFYVPANFAGQLTPRGKGWKIAVADKKLQAITSVAGNIMVLVGYHSEA